MKPKLRAAVVGAGYLGRFHAHKYAALASQENLELVAVVDINPVCATQVAAECDCRALTDFHQLTGEVDLVSVVVPTGSHFAVAAFFLENGVDVLLEKPMTVTLEEADQLIRLAKARQCILQPGHLERFNPALRALRPLLTKPVLIETTRVATFKPRGVDVSVVLDLMIHDLDLIFSMVKQPLTGVTAAGATTLTDHTDSAIASLSFADGTLANLTVSRVAPVVERRMRLVQEDGFFEVDFGNCTLTTVRAMDETATAETTAFDAADALMAEITAFVGHAGNRSRPEVSGVEGRAALAAALEVMEKIEQRSYAAAS